MDRNQLSEHLTFIKQVIEETLKNHVAGKRFTGHILFDINCTDGGIANNDAEIKRIIKK